MTGDQPPPRNPVMRQREQLRATEAAEQAKFNNLIVVAEAESVVGGARFAELDAASKAARRRLSVARGRLTRVLRGGSAERIAEAHAAVRAADTEAERVAESALAEMHQLIRAKLDTLSDLNAQIDVSWAAQAAVTGTYRRPAGSPNRPA